MKIEPKWWATHLANRSSKEIHRLDKIENRCTIQRLNPANAIYCTWLWAWWLRFTRGYNGCRWCDPKKDKG